MTMDIHHRIDKLLKSARNARTATNRAQKQAAIGFLVNRVEELQCDRGALETKLHKRWDALDADPDMPNYTDREERTIALLHDYEAICDALDDAKAAWLHDETEAA